MYVTTVQFYKQMTYAEGNNKINLLSDVLHVTLSQETWQTDFGTICWMKTHDVIFITHHRWLNISFINSFIMFKCLFEWCLAVKALSRWQIFSEEFSKLHVISAFYLRAAEYEWTEISSSAQTNTTFNSWILKTLYRKPSGNLSLNSSILSFLFFIFYILYVSTVMFLDFLLWCVFCQIATMRDWKKLLSKSIELNWIYTGTHNFLYIYSFK